MSIFRCKTLAERLSLEFFLANGFTLLCAFVGFCGVLTFFSARSVEQELSSVTRVVASTTRAALAFDDSTAATRILAGLSAKPDITEAILYRANGDYFAEFHHDGDTSASRSSLKIADPWRSTITWSFSKISAAEPVVLKGELLGVLHVAVKLDALYHQLALLLSVGLLITVAVALASRRLLTRLQRSISDPIISLRDLTVQVSNTSDLSSRLELKAPKEIRELIQSFNNMLGQLEERGQSLTAAKERAEQADRAKSIFVASMSHELRTPLHAILGITDEVLETALSREQRDLLSVVRSSGRSLLAIINDILDFSKVEAGRMTLYPSPFSLRAFMTQTEKMFAIPFAQKGVRLRVSIDPDIPENLIGDEGRLSQILVNLIGNSLKFTDVGGKVSVEVILMGASESSSVSLHFLVRDNGIGIPTGELDNIFEPFTQVNRHLRASTIEGTGLGLAITSRLVKLLGGRIWVESELGQGSVFHFTASFEISAENFMRSTAERPNDPNVLPITQIISTTERSSSVLQEVAEQAAHGRTDGWRVLVVEDNTVNQKLVDRMLTKAGHRVTIAENGQVCLDILEREDFDVILMDISMPVMDGLEATRRIRERERILNRHTPIIAVTASIAPDDTDLCFKVGMDAFLTKPLEKQTLFSEMRKLIPAASPRTEPSTS